MGDQFHCDVAILGGGPAGTATATLLARRGLSSLVLEAGDYTKESMGQTLSPSIKPLLEQLGIDLTRMGTSNPTCLGIDSAWGNCQLQRNDFLWTPYGPSWHVERTAFNRVLAGNARQAGAQIFSNTRLCSAERQPGRKWRLTICSNGLVNYLHCRFLVCATGRTANIGLLLKSRTHVLDKSIGVSWIGKTRSYYPFMLIEAVENGWFYASVLPGSRVTFVLFTDSDLYRGKHCEQLRFWWNALRQTGHLREIFPECTKSCPQRVFSACSATRGPTAPSGLLTVGDAAMSFDPISGQGVSQALAGAFHASRAIQEYFRTGSLPLFYARWIETCFKKHLAIRNQFYLLEKRWAGSPFWQRRHLG